MNRIWKSIALYLIACQPVMFILVWIISEGDRPVSSAIDRLAYDFGAYIALYVCAVWTVLVIPVAFVVDKCARGRLSNEKRRLAIILACGMAGYLSTLLLAYIVAFPPIVFAFILGCATYGAVFSMSGDAQPADGVEHSADHADR